MRQLHRTALATGAALLSALAVTAVAQETRRNADNEQDQARPGQARQEVRQEGQRPGQAIDREAQQSARQRTGAGAQAGQSGQSGAVDDKTLAAWLIADNQGEVALAEFGQQRAQTQQVREFAQRIARDHEQFIQKLQQASGQPAQRRQARTETFERDANQAGRDAQPDRDAAQPPQVAGAQDDQADDQPRTTGFRPGEQAGGRASNIVELKQQLGQQHTATMREELGRYQGTDFDKAFMHAMVMGHVKAVDTLQVFSRNASPQLRETLTQGQQTTQEHLQMARQIVQQLSREGQQGQRPGQQGQGQLQPGQRESQPRQQIQREPNERQPNQREPNQRQPNEREPQPREGATEQP